MIKRGRRKEIGYQGGSHEKKHIISAKGKVVRGGERGSGERQQVSDTEVGLGRYRGRDEGRTFGRLVEGF